MSISARSWDVFKLRNALNANVRPHPVSVLAIVRGGARISTPASRRRAGTICYRILNRRSPPALDRGKVWWLPVDLDAEAMHAAAQLLVGKHDFTTFRAAQCQAQSPVKTLDRIDVARYGELIEIRAAMPAPSCTIRCARWWARSALWAKASGARRI